MNEPLEIVFRKDENLDHIRVEFSAREETEEVRRAMDKLREYDDDAILVSTGKGTFRVKKDDICCLSSNGKRVEIVVSDQAYFTKGSLSSFENMLTQKNFVRISRFEIINLKRVKCYDFSFAGSLRIQLEGDNVVWASRRFIPIIKKILEEGGD
ncbi:MAG: LytTR family transcriptional regulator DNA-binding domain-containing protein [Clostridia bacterium]|nr:LytTR family transcriptional regulator DNA-binding domain-containing protein [Clostridia bacterium]